MLAARASLFGSVVVLLVIAASAAGTTACFPCGGQDPQLPRSDCVARSGKYDDSTCVCTGAEPYPSAYYPPPPPAVCASDVQCRRQCPADLGHCKPLAASCSYGNDCACLGTGVCTLSECATDLECQSGARCVVDESDIGKCVAPCEPSTVCPGTTNLARCTSDADCRASEGAACVLGWCYGPGTAVGDGGAPLDASASASDGG